MKQIDPSQNGQIADLVGPAISRLNKALAPMGAEVFAFVTTIPEADDPRPRRYIVTVEPISEE